MNIDHKIIHYTMPFTANENIGQNGEEEKSNSLWRTRCNENVRKNECIQCVSMIIIFNMLSIISIISVILKVCIKVFVIGISPHFLYSRLFVLCFILSCEQQNGQAAKQLYHFFSSATFFFFKYDLQFNMLSQNRFILRSQQVQFL